MSEDEQTHLEEKVKAIAERRRQEEEIDPLPDRGRGMLTTRDREFLRGLKDYDIPATRSNTRREIRDRFENGILDLQDLTLLPEGQRKKFLNSLDDNARPGALRNSLATLIHTAYVALEDVEWLEETVAQGVYSGEVEHREGKRSSPGVEVDIDISRGHDTERLKQQVEAGNWHSLSLEEIGVLVRRGELGAEDLENLSDEEVVLNAFFDEGTKD